MTYSNDKNQKTPKVSQISKTHFSRIALQPAPGAVKDWWYQPRYDEVCDRHVVDQTYSSSERYWRIMFQYVPWSVVRLRVCLHGGGGPQVSEVTRLAVVEK